MLRLSLIHVKPGMIISRSVYSANGSLLLEQGHVLDAGMIDRLRKMDLDAVYVRNPFCEVEPAEELLYESVRVEAVKIFREAFEGFRHSGILRLHDVRQVVETVIEDVLENSDVLIHLTDIRLRNDYTFGHSLSVCLISTAIGARLGFAAQELRELAVGAILHDVGMMSVPPGLMTKQEKLTSEEWEMAKGHADFGYQILRLQGTVAFASAQVAYQHHENFDGTGYPQGIRGEDIHLYARIAAVADVYDCMTSERAYRPARQPHEVYEVLLGSRGSLLDPRLVDSFLKAVVIYPEGTTLELDSGEIGVVIGHAPDCQARPKVRLLEFANGKAARTDRVIDLATEPGRLIVRVYKPEEAASLGMETE